MNMQDFFLNDWFVEVARGRITRDRKTAHLEPQVMKALAFLASNENEVVSKERLIDAIWNHSFVSDAALTRCIFEIRQAFGDNARESKIIETVPKVGYRLVAKVKRSAGKRDGPSRVLLWSVMGTIVFGAILVWAIHANNVTAGNIDKPQPMSRNALAEDAYRKGEVHFASNAYLGNENAIALFEKALAYDPSFGLAYARLSDALSRQFRYWDGVRLNDARIAASKAIQLEPLHPIPHNAYGVVLVLSGNSGDALESFKRAYTLDRTHWKSAFNAATVYKSRLEFKKAEDLFLQALEYSPDHVIAMGHLGFLYLRMGKLGQAKQWLNRALDQAPLETYAWSQMATLEMVAGSTGEAIEGCRKVVKLLPHHQGCLHVLGASNLLEGNLAQAQDWFDYASVNLRENSYAELGKAQILIAEGREQQGKKIIDKVLEKMYRDISGSDNPWEESWIIAACYALQDDKLNAFIWLNKAAEGGRRFYLWDERDPVFVSLHGDERFSRYIAMTKRVGP